LSKLSKLYWDSFDHEKSADISTLLDIFTKINRNFAGKKQYDATECFMKILETLETAFVPKPPALLPDTCDVEKWTEYTGKFAPTFISDIFLGQEKHLISDGSVTFDHFTGITVSCNHFTIEKGIEEFLNDPDTGITRVITKFPLILPVIFQRAERGFVDYNTTLRVDSANYELFSILLHVNNSHWVTLAKNPNGWNLFDDEKVTRITDINALIQRDAIMLLFKKTN
jgi:ubiquitin C-terminal hydrolase